MASLEPKKLIPQLIQQSQIHWQKLIIALLVLGIIAAIFSPVLSPDGVGIKADQSVTKTVEQDPKKNITKTVTTTKEEPGKTVWDWLSLLGVPLTLAGLGYWLQQIQQKRQADETKEEVLQVYFDRLSILLVDKNLLAIAAKKNSKETQGLKTTLEETEVLGSALDVIRARTLSILRRFEDDKERKTSVIRFLIEADFISKLKLNLIGADLIGADLIGADLNHAILSGAKLSNADLSLAILSGAKLSNADLSGAILIDADLIGADLNHADLDGAILSGAKLSNAILIDADLIGADLSGADLSGAILSGAKLSNADLSHAILSHTKNLTEEQLTQAKLCKTNLPPGTNLNPDRDC